MTAQQYSFSRRVFRLLLSADLDTVRATEIARQMFVSPSTMRRRLRREHTNYQTILDQVRRHRCEQALSRHWVPGKSIARDLGFSQPNSFYRAFGKWTGMTYTQYKRQLRASSLRNRRGSPGRAGAATTR